MATPRLAMSRGVDDSPTCRVGESKTLRIAKFSFKHSKADSPTQASWGGVVTATRLVGESATPGLTESESRRLPNSPSRRVAESESCLHYFS
jgi:hypothetical protein